ncbi:MAG: 2-C-methyl-D-erythritol 4-phosphate cytidylyltransferase [Clostridia bacterium]|nr:2-C-methyl-D-erythritol 4-phosphate cytidylyltransferase [Clostridia bacterium]
MKEKVVAIIPAAGRGTRMGAEKNKLLLEAVGRPVISWTLSAFESCPVVDEVILVANEQDIFSYRDLICEEGFCKVSAIVRGGETRAESVCRGILAAEDADIVCIHDGARALITPDEIRKVIEGVGETGAAIAAVPAVDTIKRAEGEFIAETPPRETLWQAQTPQVFKRQLILDAMEKADETVTDDASLAEKAGIRVKLIETSYRNIKITTPFDICVLEAVLTKRSEEGCV